MRRSVIIGAVVLMVGACAADPTLPTRPYQWQERQERIEREFAARQALCETLDQDSDRFARECPRRRSGAEE